MNKSKKLTNREAKIGITNTLRNMLDGKVSNQDAVTIVKHLFEQANLKKVIVYLLNTATTVELINEKIRIKNTVVDWSISTAKKAV